MSSYTPKHRVTNINLETLTAVCSICGPTRIYLTEGHAPSKRRARCVNRVQETNIAQATRRKSEKRLPDPNRKSRHSILQVDPETMRGMCSVCGPTDVKLRKFGEEYSIYLCARKTRSDQYKAHVRAVSRLHAEKPQDHCLSEINIEKKIALCAECGPVGIYVKRTREEIFYRCGNGYQEDVLRLQQQKKELIDKFKLENGCKRCGYNSNPLILALHRRNLEEKDDLPSKLVRLDWTRLRRALEKSDVLCVNCHYLIHKELEQSAQSLEERSQTVESVPI